MKSARSKPKPKDASTEEKIVAAARKIFTQKGYDATKIRDIAAAADINLSLVNYYFRSKEKLFEVIMTENVNNLFKEVGPMLNNRKSTLKEKIKFIAGHYIDMLLANPDFPRFVVHEVFSGSNRIPEVAGTRELIINSHFAEQVLSLKKKGKIKFNPLHLLMSLLGMIIMPFLAQNLFGKIGVDKAAFRLMMEERKQLIPQWIDSMIKK